jgi:hypothetical protein
MERNRYKHYTAADIERYHKGEMAAGEAHALERAALDDPFLSEAIDGYVQTTTPAADLAFLKEQLRNRNSGKVVLLQAKRRRLFIGVAAMLALLAGFGWMIYALSFKTTQNVAVRTEAAPRQEAAPVPQAPAADTVVSDAAAISAEAGATEQKRTRAENKPATATGTTAEEQYLERLSSSAADSDTFSNVQSAAAPSARSYKQIYEMEAAPYTFKARVVDETGNAVPFATVTDVKSQTATTADNAGNFVLTTPDSSATIAIHSAGYQHQQATLQHADSEATIVLQRAPGALSEVVVTANGNTAGKNRIRLEAVEPLEGWSRLNTYIDENLEALDTEGEKSKRGEVVLRFDVDRAGNAVNIAVEKQLCASCDSTAVRIIRDGSKWKKRSAKKRAKAYIRF